jgi:hypothetical protein
MHDSRTRRLYYAAIREVFLKDWNPIGVPDLPGDEYDSYIPPIYGMLAQGKSEQEIVDCLWKMEAERMGLRPDRSHVEAVARRLLLIPSELKTQNC